MDAKISNFLTKVVKPQSANVAKAMAALCPGNLQTTKVVTKKEMVAAIPLVNGDEWERYFVLEPQKPAPASTAGRVAWWQSRLDAFPTLAPIAIAYLLTPRSSALAERTFSLLGHKGACICNKGKIFEHSQMPAPDIQTCDRLNMTDATLASLAFVYINKRLFSISP